MAVADLVAESFETDALRAAIATRGVLYTATGPLVGGLGVHAPGRLGRQRRRRGRPDGLRPGRPGRPGGGPRIGHPRPRAARSARARRSPRSPSATVGRPASPSSRARRSRAGVVVAGIDPKRLLTKLVDPVTLGPTLAWRAGNIRTRGHGRQGQPGPGRPAPRSAAAGDDGERLLRGRILLAPGIDALERAFDASKYGRMSEHPLLEATIPSLVDPSLVDGAQLGRRRARPTS